jgi:hypothetical protein
MFQSVSFSGVISGRADFGRRAAKSADSSAFLIDRHQQIPRAACRSESFDVQARLLVGRAVFLEEDNSPYVVLSDKLEKRRRWLRARKSNDKQLAQL